MATRALRRLLAQPLVGFAPWIALSVLEGPGRVALAAAVAFALALAAGTTGAVLGMRTKLLDLTAIAYFGVLTVVALVAGPDLSNWLGRWAGELSNVAIAVAAILSIVFRAPFTLQYARESVTEDVWETPLFLRINYVLTAAWSVVFILNAAVGYIGDGPLNQPNNGWTNWIIPIGLMILAVKFTDWYPEYAAGVDAGTTPGFAEVRARPLGELLRPLVAYLVPVGIFLLIVGGPAQWFGLVLLIAGIVLSRRLAAERQP